MFALLWALFVGLVVGGGTSALSVYVLQVPWGEPLAGWIAYALAPIAGVLVGLLAGKPIWAKGARIEAGLKAVFGAAMATAIMFALRRWGHFHLDLSSVGLGQGAIGTHAATAFPIVATLMALVFEVDNMFGGGDDKKKKSEPNPGAVTHVRVDPRDLAEQEDEVTADEAKKSKGRGKR